MLTIRFKPIAAAAGLAALAGCTTPAPPPPPPPPPPVAVATVEAVPYRPVPPGNAPYVMTIPGKDESGVRLTVNRNLDPVETLWNFRSGWNVAALNCQDADDARIIDAYSTFLRSFSRPLSAANTELDRRFRRQHSTSGAAVRARELRMTQVYNYFAQPAARAEFCAAARAVSAQMLDSPPSDATAFAMTNLALFENAFEQFYSQYEAYQQLSAEWDRRYGAQYGSSQPGYVAVWGAQGMPGAAATMVAGEAPAPVAEVLDPATGALIPVIPASEEAVATPIVQPVPSAGGNRR